MLNNKDDIYELYRSARLAQRENRAKEAIRLYDIIIENFPSQPEADKARTYRDILLLADELVNQVPQIGKKTEIQDGSKSRIEDANSSTNNAEEAGASADNDGGSFWGQFVLYFIMGFVIHQCSEGSLFR